MAQGIFTLKQVNQAIRQGAWPNSAPKFVEYLVVAGGGGAGGGPGSGGGAGAGGLLTGTVTVAAGASYTVTVGAGGGNGISGVDSVFSTITATGGGGGDNSSGPSIPKSGGSGGGGGYDQTIVGFVGQGVFGQGNKGGARNFAIANPYASAGGGGAGAAAADVSNSTSTTSTAGGAGIASSITGTPVVYAGGGGGSGTGNGAFGGAGGVGGGGHGQATSFAVAGNGNTNTGGGGGGRVQGGSGGTGGSGIVVVRYPGNIVFYTGGTVNYNNGYISHTFNATGTLAPTAPTPYDNSYQISRSIRLNKDDLAFFSRTVGGSGNRKTWTWSGWVKRTAINTSNLETPDIFGASDNSTGTAHLQFGVYGTATDVINFNNQSGTASDTYTTAVFRDLSAWYHIVLAVDTTQATSSNRVKIYVNGALQDIAAASTYPVINTDTYINYSSFTHRIGAFSSSGQGYQLNAYLAEINFIDGQQLTPSSFGATSTTTGVWAPIKYAGTYGTNGFYLNFSDNTNTTAATLGKDSSGNGNNWTPNNFSVTAGAGNDSMVDVPTSYGFDTGVGGEVRGNYATWNPLDGRGSQTTYVDGNLEATVSGNPANAFTTMATPTTGKWYCEFTVGGVAQFGGDWMIGISDATKSLTERNWTGASGWYYYPGGGGVGTKYNNSSGVAYGADYTTGDVIGIAVDLDAGTLTFYKNGVSQGVAYNTGIAGKSMLFGLGTGTGSLTQYQAARINCGQRPFAYTAPSGFKALNTQNLPEPAIGGSSETLAGKFFNSVTYTGTTADQFVSVGFQPDWVWIKSRSNVVDHQIFDSVRGANIALQTGNGGEGNYGTLPSFNSGGVTVSNNSNTRDGTNASGYTYVAWNWRAGNNAGTSNRDGSIASIVSVNQRSGFSIVTFTGTSGNVSVGHGLGVTPKVMIVKSRVSGNWWYYTTQIDGSLDYLELNSTAIAGDASQTAPTSTVFYQNQTDSSFAYCFAPVAGYSAFGSYTGNGSTDGTFVNTGFRPAWVMIKKSSGAGNNWQILDTKRSTYNLMADYLYASATQAEAYDATVGIDSLSNGFKLRGTDGNVNAGSSTYIYMAFAESPFKYSLAR